MKKTAGLLLLGPFYYLGSRKVFGAGLIAAVGMLTVLTQIGGVVLWLCLPVLASVPVAAGAKRRAVQAGLFGIIYLAAVFWMVPALAPLSGRVPLPWTASPQVPLQPANPLFFLMARNYVTPSLYQALERTAVSVSRQSPGTVVVYLDACFPFFNGFPMLPHLSHHDGQKADLAFMYQDARAGRPLSGPPSWFGYGAYEQPKAGEMQPCRGVSSPLRWDFDRLQPLFAFARMDPVRTKILVEALSRDPGVQKILLEPHLKARMDIRSDKVRFQGCRAARHDDHIHVQL
jgi:hypothetical protein